MKHPASPIFILSCLCVYAAVFAAETPAGASAPAPIPTTQKEKDKQLLGKAVIEGNLPRVRALVENGANVNSDVFKPSALSRAAGFGHAEVVKFLLENGADIKAVDKEGKTALMWSVSNGYPAVSVVLLEWTAAHSPSGGEMPLYCAAGLGKTDVVARLLEKKVDMEENASGMTPLAWAAYLGQAETAAFLVSKGARVDAVARIDECTPLLWASMGGNAEIVELLLKKKVAVEQADAHGFSPLFHASMRGHAAVVALLLRYGANLNAPRIYGGESRKGVALLVACANGHTEVVRLLLEKGADINVKDESNFNETPLMKALWNRKFETADLLLSKGADVKAIRLANDTIVGYAASHGMVDVLAFLQEKGADLQIKDMNHWNGLDNAVRGGQLDAVKFLLTKGVGSPAQAMLRAAYWDKTDILAYFLDNGASAETANEMGETLLMLASRGESAKTAEFLLERGANVNGKDKYGNTPLMKAAEARNMEILALLLKRGAELEAKDDEGKTALWEAALSFRDEAKAAETVAFLLECGANPNAPDKRELLILDSKYPEPKPAVRAVLEAHMKQTGQWLPYLLAKTDYDDKKLVESLSMSPVGMAKMLANTPPAQKTELAEAVARQSSKARLYAGELNESARVEIASGGTGESFRKRAIVVNEYIRLLDEIKVSLAGE